MPRRVDDIGFGGFKLIQDTDGFCYGVDAVLLADFAKAEGSDKVLDLCCGNGIVPLIMEAKYSPAEITGMEIMPAVAALAAENAVFNGLSGKISVICDDVLNIEKHIKPASYSLVTCNPPYFEKGSGISCSDSEKHTARHETTAGLEDFISAAAYALDRGGRFCMVHRPSRLGDIIELCRRYSLEPKVLRMVVPRKGESANIVLISCVKGAGKELQVLPELAVREGSGFTEEIRTIYGK